MLLGWCPTQVLDTLLLSNTCLGGPQHCSRALCSSSEEEDEVVLHGGAGTPHLDYCQWRTHVGAYTSPKGLQPVDEPMTEQVHPQGRCEC